MHLAVVEIRNREAQSGILHERIDRLVRVDVDRLPTAPTVWCRRRRSSGGIFVLRARPGSSRNRRRRWNQARGSPRSEELQALRLARCPVGWLPVAVRRPTRSRARERDPSCRPAGGLHLVVEVLLDNGRQLRKQDVRRDRTLLLSYIISREVTGKSNTKLLDSSFGAELLQRYVIHPTRTAEREPALVIDMQALHLDFGRNLPWIQHQGRHVSPVHGHAIANGLRVAFDTRKRDLKLRLGGKRVHVMPFVTRRRLALRD